MQQIKGEGSFKTKRRGKGLVISEVKMCVAGTRAEGKRVRNESGLRKERGILGSFL